MIRPHLPPPAGARPNPTTRGAQAKLRRALELRT